MQPLQIEMALLSWNPLHRALHPVDATGTACTACKAHLQGYQAPGPGNGVAQRGCCGLGNRRAACRFLPIVLVIAQLRPGIAAFRPARQDGGCALPVCVQYIGIRGVRQLRQRGPLQYMPAQPLNILISPKCGA